MGDESKGLAGSLGLGTTYDGLIYGLAGLVALTAGQKTWERQKIPAVAGQSVSSTAMTVSLYQRLYGTN